MHDTPLERQLRRINGDYLPAREWLAVLCLISGGLAAGWQAAVALWLIVAAASGLAWLRRYRRARPHLAVAVGELAFGAFLGAWAAAALLDPPATARGWLLSPAERGGPAAGFVLLCALGEDLLYRLQRRPPARD